MQEDMTSPRFRCRAMRSRVLLRGVICVTALIMLAAQWVDLAALLHLSPGLPGLLLQSERANWVDWIAECLAGPAVLYAMTRIAHMLGCMGGGEAFSAGAISDLRSFAFWILVATVISTIAPFAAPPLLRALGNAVAISRAQLSGNDMLLVLISGILFQVASLLDAARRMSDDLQQIV